MPTTKRVWDPEKFSITIGEKDLVVEARSLREVLTLEDSLTELTGMSWFSAAKKDATEKEGDATEKEESAAETLDFSKVKDNLLAVGFEPLKIAIPELTSEDCLNFTIPELKFLFDVILDVNGLNLMKDLVKNFGGPLLEAAKAALPRVLASVSLDLTEQSGETTPTDS